MGKTVKERDVCELVAFDEAKVSRAKSELEKKNTAAVANMFKALADDTRMKIAYALCLEDEMCVCDVASVIGSSMATASHHLRLLRNLGLAKYRKQGKMVFYSLDDDHVKQLLLIAMEHSEEEKSHG